MVKVRNKKTGEVIDLPDSSGGGGVQLRNKATGQVISVADPTPKAEVKDPFLPGTDRVRALTERRKPMLDSLLGENAGPKIAQFINKVGPVNPQLALMGALAGAEAGAQRMEAGVANAALAVQAGKGNVLDEFIKGVKGEKLGELGDLVRTTGFGGNFNEAIASTTGMLGYIGGSNFITKGKLLKGVQNIHRTIKQHRAQDAKQARRFFVEKANTIRDSVKDVVRTVGQEVREVYKKVDDNLLSVDEGLRVQRILKGLPKAEIKRFNDVISKSKGFKLNPKEAPTTVKEANAIREILGDLTFGGSPGKGLKAKVMRNDYKELVGIISDNAGNMKEQLKNVNKRYSRMADFMDVVDSVTMKGRKKKITSAKLKGIRRTGMQGELAAFEDFDDSFGKEFNVNLGKTLQEIDQFNRQEKVQKALVWAMRGAGLSAGIGAATGLFNPRKQVTEFVGGEGN